MFLHSAFLPHLAPRLLALFLLLFGLACSKDGSRSDGDGLHFLLASEIGLVEVNGDKRDVLVRFDDGSFLLDPVVSPDGKRIAFVRQPPATAAPTGGVDFGSDVYVANRDGSNLKEVARHSVTGEFLRTPVLLPDGSMLFAVRGRSAGAQDFHVDSLDLQTGERRRLLDNALDPLELSPDAKSIAFVYVDRVSGTEQLTISGLDLEDGKPLAGTPNGLGLIQSTVWSADGSQLAFAAVDLTTPTPDGSVPSNTQQLAHPFAQDIWLVNRDGTGLRRLAELQENQPSLGWSKDGAHIYALGATGFWRISVADGTREQVGLGIPLGELYWLGP